ncbi:MAG: uncharacterized protein K0R15_2164 [Clostridiales bacterium]|jgi:C1A family cysteine protease|nr:uncharacterized protein [Clostridiales bacterium]
MKKFKLLLCVLIVLIATFQPNVVANDIIYPKQVKSTSSNVINNTIRNSIVGRNLKINVIVDGEYIDFSDSNGFPFIDSRYRTQVPLRVVCESYGIKVTWNQSSQEAVLEKDNTIIKLSVDSTYIMVNDIKRDIDTKIVAIKSRIYIPIRYILEEYDCNVAWDNIINSVVVVTKTNEFTLPQFFDGREYNKVTSVKNQGPLGTCWAFANIAALETSLLPFSYWNFSEDHMSQNTGYNISQTTGGNNMMATAYLLSWKGPVREKDDPYGDGTTTEGLKSVIHVQGYESIPDKDLGKIKEAVLSYGGVQTSLYMPLANSVSTSNYYNELTNSLYYDGAKKQNHDVVIVGWDDNYPKSNFAAGIRPTSNGAFVCKNSWGAEFGDEGYIYISYESKQFLLNNLVYTRVDDVNKYDNIYQSDLLGWVGTVGYGKISAYFSNVYTTKAKEKLLAVGFYAVDPNTSYEVYVTPEFVNSSSLNSRVLVAKGSFKNAGFYTIDFDQELSIDSKTKYAVVVKVTTLNPSYQIPIEYISGDQTKNVDLSDGEGYRSYDGKTWDRTESKLNANICLKAYTKNIE